MNTDVDVVVVGAGPTGLLLAGDLARAGVRCTVFERRAERSGLTRAFAVHAKDEEARRFYEHFDFIPSPTDPMHLFVLLKDVRRIISEP